MGTKPSPCIVFHFAVACATGMMYLTPLPPHGSVLFSVTFSQRRLVFVVPVGYIMAQPDRSPTVNHPQGRGQLVASEELSYPSSAQANSSSDRSFTDKSAARLEYILINGLGGDQAHFPSHLSDSVAWMLGGQDLIDTSVYNWHDQLCPMT
jgi:hypothetical protein